MDPVLSKKEKTEEGFFLFFFWILYLPAAKAAGLPRPNPISRFNHFLMASEPLGCGPKSHGGAAEIELGQHGGLCFFAHFQKTLTNKLKIPLSLVSTTAGPTGIVEKNPKLFV